MIYMNLNGTEKFVTMKPKTRIEEKPGAKQRIRLLPTEFICIAPSEAPQVLDWLNGSSNEAENEIAEIHLRLCFHCQEVVARLMRINEEFSKRVGRCLHLASLRNKQLLSTAQMAGAHGSNHTKSHEDPDDVNPSKSMKAGGRG